MPELMMNSPDAAAGHGAAHALLRGARGALAAHGRAVPARDRGAAGAVRGFVRGEGTT